ncbi:hypothetical protein KP004_08960 [Geomonas oryzisoli]|uniref:NERD domain-containing protein n=1 Tax=Geomonas oryzisoli TaxID=2847992 RepID=A0ABX8JAD6_9BACT|nr:hypothetical protein [Geomonas oryzisoli]QWV95283.1 hypothetical protein KP004_08960 [Geomonas oryzisoli]
MIQAELRGKISRRTEEMEDLLTSNIFSFFKYANRHVYLKGFLKSLGMEVSNAALDKAQFLFWPRYEENTEPDLVIIVDDYYILIEAKHLSGFGKAFEEKEEQLVREFKQGATEAARLEKIFRFITITSHYTLPAKLFAHLPDYIRMSLHWTNWHSIAALLLNTFEEMKPTPDEAFATDLYKLLEKKKLRGFLPFTRLSTQIQPSPPVIFFNAEDAVFRGAFIGFEQSLKKFSDVTTSSGRLFFNRTFFGRLLDSSIETPAHIRLLLGGAQ